MNPHPVVSVVITTFNQKHLVPAAIDSVLAQSHIDLDVIVVDDGSEDGTELDLEQRFGRHIRYFYQANRGQGAARNLGIRQALGEYLQFLDGDDQLLPEKVARCLEELSGRSGYQAAYCDYASYVGPSPSDGRRAGIHHDRYRSGNLWPLLLQGNFLLSHTPLVRLDDVKHIGGFDENRGLSGCEDYDLWLRLSYCGCRFRYFDEVLALYRRCENSASRDENAQRRRTIRVLEKIPTYAPELSARDSAVRRWYLSRLHFQVGLSELRKARPLRSLLHLAAAWSYDSRGLTRSALRRLNGRRLKESVNLPCLHQQADAPHRVGVRERVAGTQAIVRRLRCRTSDHE